MAGAFANRHPLLDVDDRVTGASGDLQLPDRAVPDHPSGPTMGTVNSTKIVVPCDQGGGGERSSTVERFMASFAAYLKSPTSKGCRVSSHPRPQPRARPQIGVHGFEPQLHYDTTLSGGSSHPTVPPLAGNPRGAQGGIFRKHQHQQAPSHSANLPLFQLPTPAPTPTHLPTSPSHRLDEPGPRSRVPLLLSPSPHLRFVIRPLVSRHDKTAQFSLRYSGRDQSLDENRTPPPWSTKYEGPGTPVGNLRTPSDGARGSEFSCWGTAVHFRRGRKVVPGRELLLRRRHSRAIIAIGSRVE
ncbi:unnamed protein product [Diplocarpon coronariae]